MDRETFLNYLCYKHLILNFSTEEIIDILDADENPYEAFYNSMAATSKVDPDFFIIDEKIIEKTQTIINEYRFRDEYRKNNPHYDEMFNKVIIGLNEINSFSNKNKEAKLIEYTKKEMLKRKISAKDMNALLLIISFDFEVYKNIIENNLDIFTEQLLKETTNYFLENCPAIYEDQALYNNTLDMLNRIKTRGAKEEKNRQRIIKRMDNLK